MLSNGTYRICLKPFFYGIHSQVERLVEEGEERPPLRPRLELGREGKPLYKQMHSLQTSYCKTQIQRDTLAFKSVLIRRH